MSNGGSGYSAGGDITILGSEFGGSNVNNLTLTASAAAFAEDITLTVGAVRGGVGTVSYTSGTAKTSWSYANQGATSVSGSGSGLRLDYSINRSGVLSSVVINAAGGSGGNGYAPNLLYQLAEEVFFQTLG